MNAAMDEPKALELAAHWIAAWNSHDLDRIMVHYADDVVLTSPVAARILNDPSGTVRGKTALREYFARGLAFYPGLKFELLDTTRGLNSLFCVTETRTAPAPVNTWKSTPRAGYRGWSRTTRGWAQLNSGEFPLADFDSLRVLGGIQLTLNAETRTGGRGGDQVDDDFVAHLRLAGAPASN